MRSASSSRWRWLAFAALLAASACASSTSRLPRLARGHDLGSVVMRGTAFRHWLFENHAAGAGGAPLLVFIEGDGQPWTAGGRLPAADPTARNPLAFRLFLKTSRPAWYITRPCYERLPGEDCDPAAWTSARYSREVIDSMVAALRGRLGQDGRELVLVGYSGGGVIATLLATRLPRVRGVITLAANLDVAAWTRLHGYLPLADSLDPADEPGDAAIRKVVLVGGRDTNVPRGSLARYLASNPGATVLEQADFDHVCCWLRDWDDILSRAMALL